MSRLEKIIIGFVTVLVVIGAVLSWTNEEFFKETYVVEDGALEWLTVVGFVCCAGLLAWRFLALRKMRNFLFLAVTLGGVAVCIFGAGEEISWGQRLFSIETPEWMEEHNKQKEMNLHNLMVGDISINKLVFSKMLAVGLVIYLLVMPWFYRKKPNFAALVDRLGIPLPAVRHVVLWLIFMGATEVLINTSKKGEVREFAAGFVLLVQLMRPLNGHIYDRTKRF